ncbi:hypothetical protein KR059_005234, partial [Drosophila kikkawai]
LRNIFDVVRNNADRAAAEQSRHYNLRRRTCRPPVGFMVLERRHALSNAAEAKFPSPNMVQLHVPGSRRRQTARLNQLKPYHHEDDADTEAGTHQEDTDAEDTTPEDTTPEDT